MYTYKMFPPWVKNNIDDASEEVKMMTTKEKVQQW